VNDQDVRQPALWTEKRSSMAIRISYRKPGSLSFGWFELSVMKGFKLVHGYSPAK
jgi:hypothetical protein